MLSIYLNIICITVVGNIFFSLQVAKNVVRSAIILCSDGIQMISWNLMVKSFVRRWVLREFKVFMLTLVFLQDQAISARELQQMLNGVLSRRKPTFCAKLTLLLDSYSAQIIIHTILWEHKRPAGLFLISEQLLGHRRSWYSQGWLFHNSQSFYFILRPEVQITTVKRINNKQENIKTNNMTGTTLTTHNNTTGQQTHQSNVRERNTTTQMFFCLLLSFLWFAHQSHRSTLQNVSNSFSVLSV